MRYQESIRHFVAPKDRNDRALFGKPWQYIEAVFAAGFILQQPLQRHGRIEYKIAHQRWPSWISSLTVMPSSFTRFFFTNSSIRATASRC